jgi:hypothetical protein
MVIILAASMNHQHVGHAALITWSTCQEPRELHVVDVVIASAGDMHDCIGDGRLSESVHTQWRCRVKTQRTGYAALLRIEQVT